MSVGCQKFSSDLEQAMSPYCDPEKPEQCREFISGANTLCQDTVGVLQTIRALQRRVQAQVETDIASAYVRSTVVTDPGQLEKMPTCEQMYDDMFSGRAGLYSTLCSKTNSDLGVQNFCANPEQREEIRQTIIDNCKANRGFSEVVRNFPHDQRRNQAVGYQALLFESYE